MAGILASQPAVSRRARRGEAAFIGTFWEVLIAIVIVAVLFGSIINGYLSTAVRAQWTAYSLAAQSLSGKPSNSPARQVGTWPWEKMT